MVLFLCIVIGGAIATLVAVVGLEVLGRIERREKGDLAWAEKELSRLSSEREIMGDP